MNKYQKYKPSGIEWIGDIPLGWNFNRLKWVTEIENSGIWGEDDEFVDSVKVPIPTTGQLSMDGNWYYDKMNLRNLSKTDWEKYKCITGDIIVVKSSGSSTNIITGKSGYVDVSDNEKFGFSNFLLRVRPYKMVSKLVYYFLSSNLTKQRIERMVSSTTYPNLKVEEYSNSLILIPPYQDQLEIVQFLDSKTELIDKLISKKERKITLLNEQKTSIISQVVTKGLNSNVKMKYSGVEWIGDIPEHWNTSKIKNQFLFKGGGTPSTENELYWNGDILWVSPKDMKVKFIDDTQDKITELGLENSSSNLINSNSLLIVVRSGILQRTIPVSINLREVTLNQDIKSIQSKGNIIIEFLYYFIKGNERNLLLDWSKVGCTVESIEMEYLNNFLLSFPKLNEQLQIVEYLDSKTNEIEELVQLEQKKIDLLKEYRQSLISEVVTGKIKVTTNE